MIKNELSNEKSAYLQQHAGNPVAWQVWSPESLQRAKQESKPIFLSVGYSSCHWCHVMERESFSNPQVAKILNEKFIPIKVDREERPDLDAIYMKAVQMMSGQGGWPLNVFLTTDLRPFFGGTYFPPEARYGQPAFLNVLQQIDSAFHSQKEAVKKNADSLTNSIFQSGRYFKSKDSFDDQLWKASIQNLVSLYDETNGGFGKAPKFFYADGYRILLRDYLQSGESKKREIVEKSLSQISCGGIYDQIGGGFHRYSTDDEWLVPHFEKMLYDNSLLVSCFVEAHRVIRAPFLEQVVTETLGWMQRELKNPWGGYASAMDADSDHEEGLYYSWSWAELQHLLPEPIKDKFIKRFQVSEEGNFEGKNILFLETPLSSSERLEFKSAFKTLLDYRQKNKSIPLIDRKLQVSWNALTVKAFAEAGFYFNRQEWLTEAEELFAYLWKRAWNGSSLSHVVYEDSKSSEEFLEDFAFLAEASLRLFSFTGNPFYFQCAESLAIQILDRFEDKEAGGFWMTPDSSIDVLVRSKEVQDSATPSAYAVAVQVLQELYQLTGDSSYGKSAEVATKAILGTAEAAVGGFQRLSLCVHDRELSRSVFAWKANDSDLQEIRASSVLNDQVYLLAEKFSQELETLSFLQSKLQAQTRFYVCQNGVCEAPAHSFSAISKLEKRVNSN